MKTDRQTEADQIRRANLQRPEQIQLKRYSFELVSPAGKTVFHSPIIFEREDDRDIGAITAHATHVFLRGERFFVRYTEIDS